MRIGCVRSEYVGDGLKFGTGGKELPVVRIDKAHSQAPGLVQRRLLRQPSYCLRSGISVVVKFRLLPIRPLEVEAYRIVIRHEIKAIVTKRAVAGRNGNVPFANVGSNIAV